MEHAPVTEKPFQTILAAIDGEPHAISVLGHATRFAFGKEKTAFHIVHAVVPMAAQNGMVDRLGPELDEDQMTTARDYTDRMAAIASRLFDGEVTVHLVRGNPTDQILRACESVEADLLVVGTHDYRGVKRIVMGSVSSELAKRAHCPVLVSRPLSYPASRAPSVEPLCPDCAKTRAASAGANLWCAQHAAPHPRAHVHYEYPQGFGAGSQLLRM